MNADVEQVYNILLGRGYQSQQLFSSLQRPKKQGRETIADCPFCADTGQHFSYNADKPVWKCWKCDRRGDWIAYLKEQRGLDFRDALQFLAQEAGVTLSGFDQAAYQAKVKRADILEAAQKLFQPELFQAPGKPVLDYLLQRGYAESEIKEMELGAYTDTARLEQELTRQGYTHQEIQEAGLLTKGYGSDYQFMLLWRDQAGRAIGLAGRALLSEAELKQKGLSKYKYSLGLQRDQGLIGFSRARGARDITLVEGPLDALYINSKQKDGVAAVALGGTSLSLQHIQALEATGTQQVTLALDNDAPGQKATDKAISLLSGSRLYAFVATLPPGYKDPDELVRKEGINALVDVLNLAEEWPRWRARYIVSQHDIQTDKGLTQAIFQAMEAYEDIGPPHERRYFMETLQQATGLPQAELEDRSRAQTEQLSKKKAEARLQNLLRGLQQRAAQGDIIGAELELEQGLQQLRQSRGVTAPAPYLLEDLLTDLQSTNDGLSTGYASLDKLLRIPTGAISIVAGRPGHGKTTLQLNLLVQMIRGYPDRDFYFYSYEEAKSRLGLKLIMLMAGTFLSEEHNQGGYLRYLKERRGTPQAEPAIEAAIQELEGWLAGGRLFLIDKRLTGEDLAATIGHIASRGQIGAVFVDYIQKIPLQRQISPRYLEIKEVSGLLLEQAVAQNIPIILGAQLGRGSNSSKDGGSKVRLDNLREAGDIEQDASLVLGLLNATVDKMEEEGIQDKSAAVDLQVSVLKHRAGIAGRSCMLTFERPSLRIMEKAKPDGKSPW
jgi:DNA primase catalytic core